MVACKGMKELVVESGKCIPANKETGGVIFHGSADDALCGNLSIVANMGNGRTSLGVEDGCHNDD